MEVRFAMPSAGSCRQARAYSSYLADLSEVRVFSWLVATLPATRPIAQKLLIVEHSPALCGDTVKTGSSRWRRRLFCGGRGRCPPRRRPRSPAIPHTRPEEVRTGSRKGLDWSALPPHNRSRRREEGQEALSTQIPSPSHTTACVWRWSGQEWQAAAPDGRSPPPAAVSC